MASTGGAGSFQRFDPYGKRTGHSRFSGAQHPAVPATRMSSFQEIYERLLADPLIPELQGLKRGWNQGALEKLSLSRIPGPVVTGIDAFNRPGMVLAVCQWTKAESNPANTQPGLVAVHEGDPDKIEESLGVELPHPWLSGWVTQSSPGMRQPYMMDPVVNLTPSIDILEALLQDRIVVFETVVLSKPGEVIVPLAQLTPFEVRWTLMDDLSRV